MEKKTGINNQVGNQVSNEQIRKQDDQNNIAKAINVIGITTYIFGAIAGIVIGASADNGFSYEIALTYWIGTLIIGTIFLRFAEIIKLLQKIANK